MMKKYPLTPSGIREFQEELFRYDDERLLREAAKITGDALGYLFQRFEIDVLLLEGLRALELKLARTIGWFVAIALVNRQPFSVEGPLLTTLISLKGDMGGHIIALDCPIALRVT